MTYCGRQSEVTRIIEYLNTPGQHALIYGDRGVGKSSLANIICDLLIRNIITGQLFKKRCDSSDTFATILREPLHSVGIDITTLESNKSTTTGINLGKPSFAKSSSRKFDGYREISLSPSWVCEKIRNIDGLLLIDEFDIISNIGDKKKISELIKLLSDSGSLFKLLIVGIAESGQELTAGHASTQRCLKETRISRMTDLELEQIILSGAEKLSLKFSENAVNRIVKISSGYPHFTHLLALKSAEDAIIDDQKNIDINDIKKATRRAVDDSEGTLKQLYDQAIRSSNTDEYKKILLAAACCNEEEIKAKDLREKYNEIYNTTISQSTLNNHFQRIVSEDGSNILRRIAKGVYRFSDPRMSSYIKIAQSYIEGD